MTQPLKNLNKNYKINILSNIHIREPKNRSKSLKNQQTRDFIGQLIKFFNNIIPKTYVTNVPKFIMELRP